MKVLQETRIDDLKHRLIEDNARPSALAATVGDASLCDGLIRLFSAGYPQNLGVNGWNDSEGWRATWPSVSVEYFFGEDVWGNQLTITDGSPNVFLWGHEDASMFDTALEVVDFLEALLKYGLIWTDYYSEEMLRIGKTNLSNVTDESHLHWITPLILGGTVVQENVSVVPRVPHLTGHGKLWQQISGLPPGTEIVGR